MSSSTPTDPTKKANETSAKASPMHVKFASTKPEERLIRTGSDTWQNEKPPEVPSKAAMQWSANQMFNAEAGKVKKYDEFVNDDNDGDG
jgi:hypothetical protein